LADALTAPTAVAALVLAIAGMAKLRSPVSAARAVAISPVSIRMFALAEVTLAVVALVVAGPVAGWLMAAVYAGFAWLTLVLARRGRACGCFGSERGPASPIQSLLSGALAVVAALGAASAAHGAIWLIHRPTATAMVLVLGTAAAAYGVVLAYSELPVLWSAWRPA
jgi:hypothetical protein